MRYRLAVYILILVTGEIGSSHYSAGASNANPASTVTAFVASLTQGDYAAAETDLDPTMKAAAPAAKLQQIWESLIAQLGAFQHRAGVTVATAGAYQNVTVQCVFSRATADLVVTVDASNAIAGFHVTNIQHAVVYTPPSYVHPTSFHERAITVGNSPWALPGTLTLPQGHGPFPVVVLVAGSGPEDRDETIGNNKPFRDIAWGLASQGIAVLRYDKRTLVYGAQIAKLRNFTVDDEFVTDAAAAVKLLVTMPHINHHAIYVLGHSEGAMMAPRIAKADHQIAGLVIMAGPTRPLIDVLVDQYMYLHSRGFATAAQLAAARRQATQIKALIPADRGRSGTLFFAPPSYWLSLRNYHPASVARKLTIPMLITQAARDYQVTLADFTGWKKALTAHPQVTFKLYAGLFHPFIRVPVGSPAGLATPDAYSHTGHVAPVVLRDLVAWVKQGASA